MTGKPLFFNLDTYFGLIDMYISADEVETALWLLDRIPSYYRDHPPQRLLETKEALHKAIWTPPQYAGIYADVKDNDQWPHRAHVIEETLKQRQGPFHIMELAPGSRFIETGLRSRGLDFTYECIGLDERVECEPLKGSINVFVCFELIEHLHNPHEIYQNYLKFNKRADLIFISTPLYTYGGGMGMEWRDRPLGHLRTYGPKDLYKVVSDMFVGFDQWTCHTSDTITLVGERTERDPS